MLLLQLFVVLAIFWSRSAYFHHPFPCRSSLADFPLGGYTDSHIPTDLTRIATDRPPPLPTGVPCVPSPLAMPVDVIPLKLSCPRPSFWARGTPSPSPSPGVGREGQPQHAAVLDPRGVPLLLPLSPFFMRTYCQNGSVSNNQLDCDILHRPIGL